MPTPAELCAAAPDASHGVTTQVAYGPGEWRLVVEIADLAVGSGVEWHDVSCYVTGFDLTRGAGEYQGRAVAAIANIELRARDDRLAPWNADTSPTFGVHVDLGAGLLIRAGWTLIYGGAVSGWIPRFTHRVESWSDETRASGNARIHRIVARDLLTGLVGVPLGSVAFVENWDERVDRVLTQAGWLFDHELYGAVLDGSSSPVLELPTRPEVASAIEELDATLDPVGLVWSTGPTGKIIVRPMAGDTFHADLFAGGATGNEWVAPPTVVFSYAACDDGRTEYAFGRGSQFGFDDTELNVVNHVRVTDPSPGVYDAEAPTSIARFDRKPRQFSWLVANDDVADQIVTNRAFATLQARPLLSTIDHRRFFPDVVDLEWLDPVTIWHRTAPGRMAVEADGRVRQIIERFKPRHPDEAISYSKETIVDVDQVVDLDELLPVEDLAVTDLSHLFVDVEWTNPTQTITPTETWVRIPQRSLLWIELDYPLTGTSWLGLDPETPYQVDVRLVRRENGLVTHVSPVRSVTFTTDPSPAPTVDGDGDGGLVVNLPDVDDPGACVIEWVLSSTDDGSTWTEVTSGTAAGGDVLELNSILFEDGLSYRVCSTEVCDEVPGTTYCSPVVLPTCQTPPIYGTEEPFDREDMIAFIPEICSPDRIVEAVSGIAGDHGPAWGGITSLDEDDFAVMADTSVGGVIAYGATPNLEYYGSATIAIDGYSAQNDGDQRLFAIAGLRIDQVDGTTGWFPRVSVTSALGDELTLTDSTERALIAPIDVMATYDADTGDVQLIVNGSVVASDAVDEPAQRAAQGNYWRIGAPAASYMTAAAAWSSVLDVEQSPTGGTITEVGGYRYHTFTEDGTFDPDGDLDIEYVVVGGGGGSGGQVGSNLGAGGAGGRVVSGSTTISTSQAITIGTGGTFAPSTPAAGQTGGSTVLGAVATATGGTGGGAGTLTPPSGGSNADFSGGAGYNGVNDFGGGGAGAGQNGEAATAAYGGRGGFGIEWPASSGEYYGGGGGGRGGSNYPSTSDQTAPGGLGGGGGGTPPRNGEDGRGGGGGANADGGNGVVIIRYPI